MLVRFVYFHAQQWCTCIERHPGHHNYTTAGRPGDEFPEMSHDHP